MEKDHNENFEKNLPQSPNMNREFKNFGGVLKVNFLQ